MRPNTDPVLAELCHEIQSNQHFTILSHHGPDGDGLGAMFALYWGLSSLGKEVVIASSSQPSAIYSCIPGIEKLSRNPRLDITQRIITLDAGEPSRVEYYDSAFQHRVIMIDHHASNSQFGAWNWLKLDISSTSEMVAWLLLELGVAFTPNIANSLLVGIYFDTGNLQHNVYPSTMEMVARLAQSGGNPHRIRRALTHTKPAEALKVWGSALSSLCILEEASTAYAVVAKTDLRQVSLPLPDMALDQLSNYMSTIQEAGSSLLLTERKENQYKGSLRSENFKNVDVQAIAQKFGGGGHIRASGFKHDGSVDEILAILKES